MTRYNEQGIEKLVKFGLTYLQAKVYIAIYLLDEAHAKKIIQKTEVHRAEVYRVIRELEKIGAVVPIVSHPVRYRATPPEELLKILLVPQLERLAELGEEKVCILNWLGSQKKQGKGYGEHPDDGFEVLRGKQVLKRVERMIDGASKEILYQIKDIEDVVNSSVKKPFDNAVQRGVSAKGILNVSNQDLNMIEQLINHSLVSRRHSARVYSWMVIVDRQEMITGSAQYALPDEEFLYTRNQRFIEHSVEGFELHFKDSLPIEDRIKELKETATLLT
ncbi:MAG: hypothetical protein M1503_00625 [Thaumarchaeota archaeon]|nr:hypothetical protein [Nitrososphaerota archaeon]MCL5316757.1 hypothetical protein [Nitrososphaerota archaeon]